ncbi:hypothetical protein B7494_g433 [Chlorociboria aeruginascens]|nr:hypothetical protein B7494_g433 [Chlorociboria aeruginascens]
MAMRSMGSQLDKIGVKNGMYFYILAIPNMVLSVLSLVGCVSNSPGIPGIYIAELQGTGLRFSWLGICNDNGGTGGTGTSTGSTKSSGFTCGSTISQSVSSMANLVSADPADINQIFLLQWNMSFVMPVISGVLFFLGLAIFAFMESQTKRGKPRQKLTQYKVASIACLWGSVMSALTSAYSVTYTISCLEAMNVQPYIMQGKSVEIMQWMTFSFSLLFAGATSYFSFARPRGGMGGGGMGGGMGMDDGMGGGMGGGMGMDGGMDGMGMGPPMIHTPPALLYPMERLSTPPPPSSPMSDTSVLFMKEYSKPSPSKMENLSLNDEAVSSPASERRKGLEEPASEPRKQKKKKVLLMGKSGSGKSSMRSIIFSNYVAKDTRRLGATIDVDLSHVKFLGNLTLNLWDCGGQDAFMENYLSQQRQHVFSNVGVLIYVFDIESRDFDRDLVTYRSIITALSQFSPTSAIYILIHKMDLVVPTQREDIFNDRVALVRSKSESFTPIPFATSIWDQSLYKAWAEIIHDLVPNLTEIEKNLGNLGLFMQAEEVLLFERSSFLVVSSWTSPIGALNPTHDRFERLSNIIKNFKQSTSRYTGTPKSAEQFCLFELKMTNFCLFIVKFTTNTYLLAVLPPGEARFNIALENCNLARKEFEELDSPAKKSADRGATSAGPSEEK